MAQLKSGSTVGGSVIYHTGNTGTAVASNVTTSQTDTTVGRLLKVGDFGVGRPATLPSGTDLNTFTKNGSYDADSAVNRPSGTVSWGYLRVIRHTNTDAYVYQEWTQLLGSTNRTFFRIKNGGTWLAWQEIYHTGNEQQIGVNQTWQDKTASRALGVTYTNTTGKPIMVCCSTNNNGNTARRFYLNGVLTAYINAYGTSNSSVFIVPNGATYLFTTVGQTLALWTELR